MHAILDGRVSVHQYWFLARHLDYGLLTAFVSVDLHRLIIGVDIQVHVDWRLFNQLNIARRIPKFAAVTVERRLKRVSSKLLHLKLVLVQHLQFIDGVDSHVGKGQARERVRASHCFHYRSLGFAGDGRKLSDPLHCAFSGGFAFYRLYGLY